MSLKNSSPTHFMVKSSPNRIRNDHSILLVFQELPKVWEGRTASYEMQDDLPLFLNWLHTTYSCGHHWIFFSCRNLRKNVVQYHWFFHRDFRLLLGIKICSFGCINPYNFTLQSKLGNEQPGKCLGSLLMTSDVRLAWYPHQECFTFSRRTKYQLIADLVCVAI